VAGDAHAAPPCLNSCKISKRYSKSPHVGLYPYHNGLTGQVIGWSYRYRGWIYRYFLKELKGTSGNGKSA
jgi:hypothetical protein